MKNTTLRLTRGALIAALYVILTCVSASLGLHNGVIQFRASEALCILPIFLPEAVPGLAVGCLISNLATGCAPWDVVFGSLATLIGAVGTYLIRKLPKKLTWLAPLPPILSNALIIPIVLIYAYSVTDGYLFLLFTVGVGELLSAGVCGLCLYYAIKKTNLFNQPL